jgi:arylsulfatase
VRGNRSFYREGWKLVALHPRGAPYDDGEWELYDIVADPTETVDQAGSRPDMVRELSEAWERSAWENLVFPLDDGTGLLQVLRRPDEASFHEPVRLLPGTPTLERYRSQKLIAFRDFVIQVELDHRPEDSGVLVAHGDQGGGYSLYIDDGVLRFAQPLRELHLVDAGRPSSGLRTISLGATAGDAFTWDFAISIDGVVTGTLPGADAVGVRAVPGHRCGIDRRSPVVWSVYETRCVSVFGRADRRDLRARARRPTTRSGWSTQ